MEPHPERQFRQVHAGRGQGARMEPHPERQFRQVHAGREKAAGMNPDELLAVIGATVGAVVALVTVGLARAPGCRELRWLAIIASTAGAVCALRSFGDTVRKRRGTRVVARILVGGGGVLAYGWLRYEASDAERQATPLDRALGAIVLAIGALALVPSVVLGSTVVHHVDPATGARYADVAPTASGVVALAILFAVPILVLARYVARAHRGERRATAHALALGGIIVAASIDVVEAAWIHRWMHVMPLGLLWMIGAVGVALVGRFVEGAQALAELSGKLRETVVQRNVELASTRATLADTEQLATLGRLSAAVAHEINNPAAVVAANLSFLQETIAADAADRPEEEAAAIADTLESIDRIVRIVRQLGEAGELAVHGGMTVPVSVATLAHSAVTGMRSDSQSRIAIDVPDGLHAVSQEASLKQVLSSLVASALEAGRASGTEGRITIRAERRADRVVVWVEDPTPEADDVLRARRFGPFTDPRPTVVRGDVGLTVSVALLRMFGGDIQVERADDTGSVVRIDLRAGTPPTRRSDAPVSSTSERARVLVVDDDVLTRIGFRRLLGREYAVEEAGGVDEALARVQDHGDDLDVIVCDVVMPEGGAGRLLQELERVAPQLAKATVLLTGGAVDGPSEALVRAHAARVLRKPVDIATLRGMVERVRRRRRLARSRNG